MKSRKNLTRFAYENAAFEGWRLCVSRLGTTFTKYFSDKKYASAQKALTAASKAKDTLLKMVTRSRLVNGQLSTTTVKKINKMLKDS